MPAPIEQCVRRQNIRFLHNRNQFTLEYFRFMKRILVCNIPYIQPVDDRLVSLAAVSCANPLRRAFLPVESSNLVRVERVDQMCLNDWTVDLRYFDRVVVNSTKSIHFSHQKQKSWLCAVSNLCLSSYSILAFTPRRV